MVQCPHCGQAHDAFAPCDARRSPGRTTLVGVDEALVGNVVAERYQVGDVLGKGATGTVFAIEHLTFARAAAMKVLRPHYAEEDLVSRVFHGEARSAWTVLHPNLCEVFDIGALPDGAPFFVMERLAGETLATRIARERLSVAAAVDVAMQMLSAIAAIHARDLLLRDLRPQNLYLSQRRGCRPLLKILDFGLARLTPLDRIHGEWDALRATVGARDSVGSTAIPYYLSPERTRGEHGIEPASDLFVAAVIFYEALTGERPFSSSSFEGVLQQICQATPIPLYERRPELPPELSAFVSRALSPSPRNRPASARDMQDELRAIFEGARNGERKGSLSMQVVAPISVAPSVVDAPRMDAVFAPRTGAGSRPGSGAHPVEPPLPDSSYDDTRTDKRVRIGVVPAIGQLPRVNPETFLSPEEVSTASRQLNPSLLDEASADSGDRTVPPPRPDTDAPFHIDVEAALNALTAPAGEPRHDPPSDEDDETDTMQLSPELKARVDELINHAPVHNPALPRPRPPPQRGAKRRG